MQISFLFSYRQIYLRCQSLRSLDAALSFHFTFLFGRAVYKRRNGKVMQPQITNASVHAVVFSEKEKLSCTSGSRERAASHRAQTETINRSCVPATKSISQRKIQQRQNVDSEFFIADANSSVESDLCTETAHQRKYGQGSLYFRCFFNMKSLKESP